VNRPFLAVDFECPGAGEIVAFAVLPVAGELDSADVR